MFELDIVALKMLIGMAFFVGLVCFVFSISGIKQDMPTDDRLYMDPLPGTLRSIWPLVNFFSFYIGDRFPVEMLVKISKDLQRSGVSYLMTPEQYIGLKITGAVLMAIFAFISMLLLETYSGYALFFAAVLGFFLPKISLRDLKKKREKAIIRALPTYLDFLTMAVQAGMNMTGSIQQAVDKGPQGPLNVEFKKVLRDIKAGMPRTDSIRELSERNNIKEITAFVTSVIQAEKTGASVGNTLKVQADQRRVERFQRAEKLAMEAPVKLIFPLVVFIFPMTFLALGFPIVMKFMYEL
ncbi:type II secretion system F family protein [Agarilytica rhodophyticola]|uniref:type II secretion system F family protein n=1 Tax=Agarilytica rhodophyticola TaxID=1737490 RepID=UPI000B344278|nr:type II secretion system F family protein [Agarilytica rhodophyticola]